MGVMTLLTGFHGILHQFFDIYYLCEMSKKSYSLVAWTVKGSLKVIPSLLDDISEENRQEVEEIEGRYKDIEYDFEEVDWLLDISASYERLAQCYLQAGYKREAFEALEQSAIACTCCSDWLWLQGARSEYPVEPLLSRFYVVHEEILDLADQSEEISLRYEGSEVESDYLLFTQDDWDDEQEILQHEENVRAWSFGNEEHNQCS